MIPSTSQRVPEHTDEKVQQELQRRAESDIAYFASRLDQIDRRLSDLQREWDVERALEVNAGALAAAGGLLALILGRGWGLLPLVVGSFLAQHAVQGWCPPLPLLRRMGLRTQREIDDERTALKALRGDFANLPKQDGDPAQRAQAAYQAACCAPRKRH
jgi:hypothetical protein